MNIQEQLSGYPEHFEENHFFRSDGRLKAVSSADQVPPQHLAYLSARGGNPAYSEVDEFCAVHPFSGFAAFMD